MTQRGDRIRGTVARVNAPPPSPVQTSRHHALRETKPLGEDGYQRLVRQGHERGTAPGGVGSPAGWPNPAQNSPSPDPRGKPLDGGYALIGPSCATNGWGVTDAVPDRLATLHLSTEKYGTTRQTLTWGTSYGGLVTTLLTERHADLFRRLPVHVRPRARRRRQLKQHSTLDPVLALRSLLAPTSGSLFGRDPTAPHLSEHCRTMLGEMVIAYLTSDGERPATASEG